MSHQVVRVRREAVAPCMTCPLCHKLFRDATTIIECLHTFCRKCIYKKLSDEEMECCPICNIDLGCVPLEKLRPDHNLQDVRSKIFPYKRLKVKAPEVASPVTLPAKRKERSLSSLVVSTPRVSTQSGMTGRRSRSIARKASKGSSFTIEKPVKKEEDSIDDDPESSSSPETLNKFTQSTRQNSAGSVPSHNRSPDKGREKGSEAWEGKVDLWKPLNCLVEAANRSKSSKFSTQGSVAKTEARYSHDNEGILSKSKNKEYRQKSKVQDEKNYSDHTPESDRPKKLRKIRQKKARNFGEFRVPPQVVLDAGSAKFDRRNYPIWFSLVASDEQEGDGPPLHQIAASYVRIKWSELSNYMGENQSIVDLYENEWIFHASGYYTSVVMSNWMRIWDGTIPVSFIQKYLRMKLDLTSEEEVEIKCMGQTIIPTLTLNNLVDLWLHTTTTERVSATIGSSAKDFVMVLDYARRVPDS